MIFTTPPRTRICCPGIPHNLQSLSGGIRCFFGGDTGYVPYVTLEVAAVSDDSLAADSGSPGAELTGRCASAHPQFL
jgi:hypothetical protein